MIQVSEICDEGISLTRRDGLLAAARMLSFQKVSQNNGGRTTAPNQLPVWYVPWILPLQTIL